MTSPTHPTQLPLCDRCSEPIGSSQEAIPTATQRLFHRNCFACSKRQCGRILSLAEYGVHQNQIFCPNCFLSILQFNNSQYSNGKLAINGNDDEESVAKKETNEDQNGGQGPIIRYRSYEHQLRTLHLQEDEDEGNEEEIMKIEQKGVELNGHSASIPTILIRMDRSTNKIIKNDCCPFGASPIPEADELEERSQPSSPSLANNSAASLKSILSPTWRIQSPKYSPNLQNHCLGSAILPLRPSNCKRCSGRVYEAEKVVAASEVWHKSCFRCLRCSRSLEPGKFSDRIGEIYCNSCYAKEFGPKGVGCGVGAGILQMYQ